MNSLKSVVSVDILRDQIVKNNSRIKQLKKLFGHKDKTVIINDRALFEDFNEIMMDPTRIFPAYDPKNRIELSKNTLRHILQKLQLKNTSSYCDVGCGMGYHPRAAAEVGFERSLGIDINRKRFHEEYLAGYENKLSFLCQDITNKGEDIGKFQLVTSFSAFEHFADPRGMLASMANLVEKNGYLYARFSPIYYCTNGHHRYREVQVPWFHILFAEKVWKKKYPMYTLNKWSALDFFTLFANFTKLRLISINVSWDLTHFWYAKVFPHVLPPYGLEELLVGGFEVIYQKE